MENFQRAFDTSLSSDGSISGKVVEFDKPYFADGMQEVISSDTEIEIPRSCTALLSHKKEFPIGKKGINLFLKRRTMHFTLNCGL